MTELFNNIKNTKSITWLFEDYFSKVNMSKLLTLHFVISSIGLIVIAIFIAGHLANLVRLPEHLFINLYPWARGSTGIGKVTSLLQYVFPIIIIFIYYPATFLLSKKFHTFHNSFHDARFPKIGFFYLFLLLINVSLVFVNKEKAALFIAITLMWLIFFLCFPISVLLNRKLALPMWLAAKSKMIFGTLICIISVHYVTVFYPLIGKPIVIDHDYVNISKRTTLSKGKVVDNLDYINSHQINGLQIYDPRKNTAGTQIKVENCQKFYRDLVLHDNANKATFDCDESKNYLIVKVPFVSLEEEHLKKLLRTEPYSEEEKEFISLNTEDKLERQLKRGWFLYHHGYTLGPMTALSLNASSAEQTMVYGWLNTVAQGKILESLGMLSYQGYFKAYFSIFIIYFAVFMLGIWLIYKDFGTVIFSGVLATSAVLILGLELLKLAPGFNPARHFFDVLVFYFLYRYLSDNRNYYLFAAATLALFAVLWSKDMGLFLATSVGCTLILYGIWQSKLNLFPLLAGILTITTASMLFVSPMPGSNPTSIYMLLGVGTPIAPPTVLLNLILIVSLLLVATLWLKQIPTYKILTLGMAFYFVQSLTYFVWYPSMHHVWGAAPVFIFWLAALYHGWISQCTDEKKANNRQLLSLGAILLLIYIPASVHFSKERKEYLKHIGSHPLYQWTFERGTFASTMDPSLFEEATQLIKQHSPDNAIYIISKYDHVLPILAGRYSAMPYNELLTNLVSTREAAVAAKAIIDHKPKYLFVDTDIGRSYINGAPKSDSANNAAELAAPHVQKFYSEATSREKVLDGLKDVFLMVTDKYEKCKTGGLISVYCRKSD